MNEGDEGSIWPRSGLKYESSELKRLTHVPLRVKRKSGTKEQSENTRPGPRIEARAPSGRDFRMPGNAEQASRPPMGERRHSVNKSRDSVSGLRGMSGSGVAAAAAALDAAVLWR